MMLVVLKIRRTLRLRLYFGIEERKRSAEWKENNQTSSIILMFRFVKGDADACFFFSVALFIHRQSVSFASDGSCGDYNEKTLLLQSAR